ncbi:MAG: hypothetical protein COY39_03180 [Alphaproteobacteria bacterium CG_4_10_14_0_8_um_filter_37_21]|nr:MAG: hypothetical protein COY39_03180 [Alphaproteobacteria bacterium CG_4_10_14_0_8_um_filter_37_21]
MLNKIKSGNLSICIVGLGYVGLPLAMAFASKGIQVVGFDISQSKIASYKNGIDVTHEIGNEKLSQAKNGSIGFAVL